MGLRSQAAIDRKEIIDQDGEAITLTAPDTTVYNVNALVFRVDIIVDPDTGVKIYEPKTSATVSLLNLNGNEPTEEWKISVTDGVGNVISGQVKSPLFDRTLADVTMIIEAVE